MPSLITNHKKIKVFCSGAEGYTNGIDRIKQGFLENDCELTTLKDADLIFCLDAGHYVRKEHKKQKLIYCVLDIPPHLLDPQKYDISEYTFINHNWSRNYNIGELKEKLFYCDKVVCISNSVKNQLKKYCNINASVIYYPIKNVSFLNLKEDDKIKNKNGQPYKYLYVGRALDPNKRIKIVYDTLKLLEKDFRCLAILGSEDPGFGDYYGVVDDEILNLFYNSCEYLFLTSAFEGLGLSAIESVITYCKPIVCEDNPTMIEIFNNICLPNDPNIICENIKNKLWNKKVVDFIKKNNIIFKNKFCEETICKNILNL